MLDDIDPLVIAIIFIVFIVVVGVFIYVLYGGVGGLHSSCTVDADCKQPLVCDTATKTCRNKQGSACNSDLDCTSNATCAIDGVCTTNVVDPPKSFISIESYQQDLQQQQQQQPKLSPIQSQMMVVTGAVQTSKFDVSGDDSCYSDDRESSTTSAHTTRKYGKEFSSIPMDRESSTTSAHTARKYGKEFSSIPMDRESSTTSAHTTRKYGKEFSSKPNTTMSRTSSTNNSNSIGLPESWSC